MGALLVHYLLPGRLCSCVRVRVLCTRVSASIVFFWSRFIPQGTCSMFTVFSVLFSATKF